MFVWALFLCLFFLISFFFLTPKGKFDLAGSNRAGIWDLDLGEVVTRGGHGANLGCSCVVEHLLKYLNIFLLIFCGNRMG